MTFLEAFTVVFGIVISAGLFTLFFYIRRQNRKMIDHKNNLRNPKAKY